MRALPVKLVIALKPSTQHFALLPVALICSEEEGGGRREGVFLLVYTNGLGLRKIVHGAPLWYTVLNGAACGVRTK